MNTLLLVITLLSLAGALAAGALAWRLDREARARSAARIAAVRAAARREASASVAIESPAGSIGAELGQARPDPHPPDEAARWHVTDPARPRRDAWPEAPRATDAWLGGPLFGAGVGSGSVARQAAAIAAVGVLLAPLVVVAAWRGAGSAPGGHAAAAPIELVALGHEQAGTLVHVTGRVRNPARGAPIDGLAAVVVLYDGSSRVVAESEARVDAPHLAPGAEAAFVVTLPAVAGAARYRVSFRAGTGALPHVDRRPREAPRVAAGARAPEACRAS